MFDGTDLYLVKVSCGKGVAEIKTFKSESIMPLKKSRM